jgi:small conductance mechanosensitive channel
MLIVSIGITLIFIATFITHIFDGKSRKAKTISALLRSLCKYIIIIAMICVILVVWGVDVVGIIAGVGVLTLIVGLGCQSLIQDVISGIFIVFDDYFAVGDTVIIDGFRGTIVDVGLKTTKLQDFGGNIKSITNSSIVTVVNMSRLRSVASVTLSVSYNEDVERVEALIIQEVEALKTKVPNIIEGPWYKGIDNVSASSIDFLVLAFTDEANRFQVTRDLKREFYLLFKKNNVQIPYPQVTVNPEDSKDRPKATKEEITLALQEQRKLRGLEPIDVKKSKGNSVVRRMKKALDKTESEFDGK